MTPHDSFRDLDRSAAPPPALKQRVIGTLRQRGALRSPRRVVFHPALAAAVLLVAALAGYAAGRTSTDATPALLDAPRFAVLLYEDSTFRPPPAPDGGVAEYTAWAGALAMRGQLELGEKLNDDVDLRLGTASVAPAHARDAGRIFGFFVIRAADIDDAERVARTCPHLKYGGTISVRPIDAT